MIGLYACESFIDHNINRLKRIPKISLSVAVSNRRLSCIYLSWLSNGFILAPAHFLSSPRFLCVYIFVSFALQIFLGDIYARRLKTLGGQSTLWPPFSSLAQLLIVFHPLLLYAKYSPSPTQNSSIFR